MFPCAKGIAIVDDDEDLLELISEMLEGHYLISFFHSAEDLIEAIDHGYVPKLVLTDIRMGNLSGFDLCKNIKVTLDIPLIFMSGASDRETLIQAVESGADDLIEKPFSRTVLLNMIEKYLCLSCVHYKN
jgi:two-component system response regulator RegX3